MERATTLPSSPPTELLPATSREHSRRVRTRLMEAGLHDGATWRISPTPFLLTSADLSAIQSLGPHLLRFTHALNRLYYESVRGAQPTWVADYLDQGKPPDLIAYARMNRFHAALPGIIRPDLILTEDGLFLAGSTPITALYRFFELFDLKNIPKSELIMYAAKKGHLALTPPMKPWLEEKMAFALVHHPALEPFWSHELGADTFELLHRWMPKTWILDPRPVPPHAIIPGLTVEGRSGSDWKALATLSQKGRRFVIKPSGFSELAWGSRGVSVGHDLPQTEWAAALEAALASFPRVPHILQEFRKGRHVAVSYHDPAKDDIVPMPGRVRLSPYYFIVGDHVELGGILATVCPLDKKLIHGMREAVMVPCALAETAPER